MMWSYRIQYKAYSFVLLKQKTQEPLILLFVLALQKTTWSHDDNKIYLFCDPDINIYI